MKRPWTFCKKKRTIWSIIYLEIRTKLKRKTKPCRSDWKPKKDKWLSLKKITVIFRILQVQPTINWMRNSLGREKIWVKDVNNLLRKCQREIELYFLLKIRKRVSTIKSSIKISNWMNSGKKLNLKRLNWSPKLKTSKPNMINQWMKTPKVKLTLREKKLLKIKRLLSRSKELKTTMFRWSKRLIDMRSVSRVKKRMPRRSCKKEFREFNKKKRMLRRNMNKRENHSKIWRSKSSRFNLKTKEKMQYN